MAAGGLQAQEFYVAPMVIAPADEVAEAPRERPDEALPDGVDPADPDAEPDAERPAGPGFLDLILRKPFRITVSARQGYDDNVFTSRTDRIGSMFTNTALGISYSLGTPRLRLSAFASGGITYYYDRPGEKTDFSGVFNLAASYRVSPRMNLFTALNMSYYSQPSIEVEGTSLRRDQNYFFGSYSLSLAYQWLPRFSTVSRYSISTVIYMDQRRNEDLGFVNQIFSQSLDFLLWPTTTLVAEYRFNPVTYFEQDLDSYGNLFLLGWNHIFSPRSRWNFRAGAELRFNENPIDGDSIYLGPFVESRFVYRYGRRSDIAWTLRYGTEPSGLRNVTQRESFRTGLGITHSITPRITANFSVFYLYNYYSQRRVIRTFNDNNIQATLGLNYQINRVFSVSAGYRYTTVISDSPAREYYRNVVFAGVNATF